MSCWQSLHLPSCDLPWYALRTRSNGEHIASAGLRAKGYDQYFPTYRAHRRWSDRTVVTNAPLFPGYIFCRFDAKEVLPVVSTAGVVSVIGFGTQPAPILDHEIEAIQAVLSSGAHAEPCTFLKEGQRIRVCYGALKGTEGILVKKKAEWRLVISVTLLQRSLSVEVDRDCVTAA